MIIGIAGPYSADTAEQRQANLDVLNIAAARVLEKGHMPFIGVNVALPVLLKTEQVDFKKGMMDMSMALMHCCDALLFLGESPGANVERNLFLAKKLPIYTSVDEIPNSW
jgi:hypothetical protein